MQNAFVFVAVSLLAGGAVAEGGAELGAAQALRAGTQLYVDIFAPQSERITWVGTGVVEVTGPTGAFREQLGSGETFAPADGPGAYGIQVTQDQNPAVLWDIDVEGAPRDEGRLFSHQWQFDAGSFSSAAATDGSFYALVPSGPSQQSAVIELRLAGFAGYVYDIAANRSGVDGQNAGTSVGQSGNQTTAEYEIYLQPPARATYSSVIPDVTDFRFDGGAFVRDPAVSSTPCDAFVPDSPFGGFAFTASSGGTYHLQCDLNGDGVFERGNGTDLNVIGPAVAGENEVVWNGVDAAGTPLATGTYTCRLELHVGEFHFVGRDIETSFPGMRIYEVSLDRSRSALSMFWDDTSVQASARPMPNGDTGLASGGENGIAPGSYADAAVPNSNARSWGDFTSGGKGNQTFLDTFVWLESAVTIDVSVRSVDGTSDQDDDGLTDFEEDCRTGTDPTNPDTDGDGVIDGAQYPLGESTSSANGGLESNGRRATAIAKRAVRNIRAGFQDNLLALVPEVDDAAATMADSSLRQLPQALLEIIPTRGPRGATRVFASPADIAQLTNAVAVDGVDFLDANGSRIGSVLLIETSGEHYEHSKAICDRVHGAELLSVDETSLRGHSVLRAHYRRADGARDHALHLIFREEVPGQVRVGSSWLREGLTVPAPGERVIEAQVWARAPGDELHLANALLNALDGFANVAFDAAPSAPIGYFQRAMLTGEGLSTTVVRPRDGKTSLRMRVFSWDGTTSDLDVQDVSSSIVTASLADARDVEVDLLVNGNVTDRVWLSDGVFVSLQGTLESSGETCRTSGAGSDDALSSAGLVAHNRRVLGGCAVADEDARVFFRQVGVTPEDLRIYDTLLLSVSSPTPVKVCIESEATASFGCSMVAGDDEGPRWAVMPLQDFRSATGSHAFLSSADILSFTREPGGSSSVSISGISFVQSSSTRGPSDDGLIASETGKCTCTSLTRTSSSWLVWAFLFGGILVRRRRGRSRDSA